MRPPRSVLVVSYLLFSLAGAFFMFWGPNTGVRVLLGSFGFYVWNILLMTGGLVGAVGAWRRKFRIEIIASPPLTAGLCVYGIYILNRIDGSPQPGTLAGLGTIFVGAGFLFLGKGLAIYLRRIRVANAVEKRSDGAE